MTKTRRESPSSEDFWFFGIHIARKTDILALTAFLISLGGILLQIRGCLRGPVIRIFAPPQIVILKDSKSFPSGRNPVRFAALVAYVNDGDTGYNATIRRELLHYQLAGTPYTQIWQQFTASDVDPGGKINMHPQGVALPIVINAGGSASHETYFTPLPVQVSKDHNEEKEDEWKNFLEWKKFLNDLEKAKSLTIEIEAQVYDHKSAFTRCTIDINQDVITRLRNIEWYAPTCWESPGKTEGF
ncbi:MAG: hypothetical protein JO166_05225 [Deltaproteobacteria bacterium]|nr:hypothetical protein [Deltaproteobacteria bacterium]